MQKCLHASTLPPPTCRASSSRQDLVPGSSPEVLPLSGALLLRGITLSLQSRLVLEVYCAKPGVAGMPTR